MTHPIIPHVLELATPVAESLGLAVVNVVFQTNQRPPVLRVDVQNLTQDTGLEDCERMSHALEARLDQTDLFPNTYVLEISSPGISRALSQDREFLSFKGFPIHVSLSEPVEGQMEWSGNLVSRDETTVTISRKGRLIALPRHLVQQVQLDEPRSRSS
jgi:ribosome maturation factor RimP